MVQGLGLRGFGGSGLYCRAQNAGADYEELRIHVIAMIVAVSRTSFSYCCVARVDLVLGLPGALMCLTAGGVCLGSPGGPSRELPLLLGVPGPLTGTRPTDQVNLRQWLLLTASALFVLVPAISLVEALRNLLEQYVPRRQAPAGGGFSSPWTPSSPTVSPTCPRVGPRRLRGAQMYMKAQTRLRRNDSSPSARQTRCHLDVLLLLACRLSPDPGRRGLRRQLQGRPVERYLLAVAPGHSRHAGQRAASPPAATQRGLEVREVVEGVRPP